MSASSLMQELKQATGMEHRRLEASAFFIALADGSLPQLSFIGHLRAFAMLHAVLEPALATSKLPGLAELWRERRPKLPLVLADLDGLGELAPDIRPAVEAMLAAATRLRSHAMDEPAALVGYLYVMEGTTLGNAVHTADAARVLNLPNGAAPASYRCYGDRLATNWRDFAARVDALELTTVQRGAVLAAACELFAALQRIHAALFPYAQTDLCYCATTLNPEAGNHPVPQDPIELHAAIRAGVRCSEAFPYFRLRYAERGKRFTDSDAAWLATLCELSTEAALAQVRWLAGVLAARGMPSLTLEQQLLLLHEELCLARPERSADYAILEQAAHMLQTERCTQMTEPRQDALVKSFEQRVTKAELARFPEAGRLILSAVLDERLGRQQAVTSLTNWLADPAGFSPEWIAALQDTIAAAQSG